MPQRIYETSKRLGPISHDQLSRAFARFELGDLLTVKPVPLGLFGQNLFVTSSAGEFVFRGAPHGPTQFPTERFFTRLLHERTSVPVPWPYQIDDSCDFFPWSYVIMPRMPGLQVTDRKVRRDLSGAEQRAIARAMAYNLGAMQQVTMPWCARYDPDRDIVRPVPVTDHADWPFNDGYGEVIAPPSHRELVTARVRRILERAHRASDRTTPRRATRICSSACILIRQNWIKKQESGMIKPAACKPIASRRWECPSTLTRGFADPWSELLPNNAFDAQNLQLAVRIHQRNAARGRHGGSRR